MVIFMFGTAQPGQTWETLLDQQAHKEQLDHKEHQVRKVAQEPLDRRVALDHKALQVRKERLALLVLLVAQDHKEQLDPLDLQALQDQLVLQVKLDHKEQLDL